MRDGSHDLVRLGAVAASISLFTIAPGAPAKLEIAATDTAVMLGEGPAWPQVDVRDRYDNVRPDPVTFEVAGRVLGIRSRGAGGETFGAGVVMARLSSLRDTMRVSVVPPGVIVSYRDGRGSS